jgi:hypothetical protein
MVTTTTNKSTQEPNCGGQEQKLGQRRRQRRPKDWFTPLWCACPFVKATVPQQQPISQATPLKTVEEEGPPLSSSSSSSSSRTESRSTTNDWLARLELQVSCSEDEDDDIFSPNTSTTTCATTATTITSTAAREKEDDNNDNVDVDVNVNLSASYSPSSIRDLTFIFGSFLDNDNNDNKDQQRQQQQQRNSSSLSSLDVAFQRKPMHDEDELDYVLNQMQLTRKPCPEIVLRTNSNTNINKATTVATVARMKNDAISKY